MTENEILCPLHCTANIFPVAGERKIISSRNDQKIFINEFYVVFEIWLFQWLFPITTPKYTGSKNQAIQGNI